MSQMRDIGAVERAFQLAKSGTCHNLGDIRCKLEQEGYLDAAEHLRGSLIKKQLLALIPPLK